MLRVFVIFIVIILTLPACDYYFINAHKHSVGHISSRGIFSDDENPACFPEKIFPSYSARNPGGYYYGKDSLEQYFRSVYKDYGNSSETGYITIRFVLNCEGETGFYEVIGLGMDYKEREFSPRTIAQFENALRSLDGWEPLQIYDSSYDSYHHLTFKLKNGKLSEVLP